MSAFTSTSHLEMKRKEGVWLRHSRVVALTVIRERLVPITPANKPATALHARNRQLAKITIS